MAATKIKQMPRGVPWTKQMCRPKIWGQRWEPKGARNADGHNTLFCSMKKQRRRKKLLQRNRPIGEIIRSQRQEPGMVFVSTVKEGDTRQIAVQRSKILQTTMIIQRKSSCDCKMKSTVYMPRKKLRTRAHRKLH